MSTIICSRVESVSGKPYDHLQVLCHLKHNILYVVLQESKTQHYMVQYSIYNA